MIEMEDIMGSEENKSYIDSAINLCKNTGQTITSAVEKENEITPRKSDQYQQHQVEPVPAIDIIPDDQQ